jgi:ClpP class serine protease
MTVAYPRIAERLFGHAHAIEPGALRAILDGKIARRILSGDKVETKSKKDKPQRVQRLSSSIAAEPVSVAGGIGEYALTAEGVAIVPICGVLSRRFDWLTALCGWTTYDGLAATFDAMLADQRVRAILMDIESPGGEAAGMLDISDKIIAARADKPVWAVANPYAASAAYGIGGSAERLLLPRLGQVGSIGCVIVHIDQSAADHLDGLNYTAVFSGARKIDGWGHAPLSSEATKSYQRDVDHVREEFAALVARQGRISAAQAMSTEAEVLSDDDAVKAGLADGIATFEDALAELTDLAAGRSHNSGAAAETAVNHTKGVTMTTKTSAAGQKPAATAENEKPAVAAAAAIAPAAEAPAAEAEAPKKPAPGETCSTCGHMQPTEEAAAAASIAAAATAASSDYTAETISETLELCAIAGAPLKDAQAYVAAKTPVAKVRSDLAAKRAAAGDANPTVAATDKPATNAGWDDSIAKANKQFGVSTK